MAPELDNQINHGGLIHTTNTNTNTTTSSLEGRRNYTSSFSSQNDNNESKVSTPCHRPAISSPLVTRIISGSAGAMITALAVTPLDVVKVRQQATSKCPDCGTFLINNGLMECVVSKESFPLFRHGGGTATVPNAAAATLSSPPSPGTFQMLRQIFAKEGFTGMYAGLAPTLVMSVPNTVLYFTAYDEIVSRLRRRRRHYRNDSRDLDGNNDVIVPLVGGSSARVLATVVTSPLELIRTQRALHRRHSRLGLFSEMAHAVRHGGVTSLYKGLGPTLWRDVPFSGIYWLCLENLKRRFAKMPLLGGNDEGGVASSSLSPLVLSAHVFLSGMISGMVAAAFTTPFDVVKTRRQMVMMNTVENAQKSCDHGGAMEYRVPGGNNSNGMIGQMRDIVRTEGVTGLWRGNQTRMIKVAPACAVMISCYELGKNILGSIED